MFRQQGAESRQLLLRGQVTPDEQIGGLDEAALFRQYLDRNTAVTEYPLVAVDVGYRALASAGVALPLV